MLILEVIVDILSIVSNIAIVITMIYAIKKFKQDKLNVIEDLEWRRKNETIVFSCEILKETDYLLSEIKRKVENETVNISDIQRDPMLEKVIIQYLTLMERLSVGLNTEVYDINVYARICRGKTIRAWKQLENIVYDKRKTLEKPSLYEEFELVVEKLKNWIPRPAPITKGNYEPLK